MSAPLARSADAVDMASCLDPDWLRAWHPDMAVWAVAVEVFHSLR
jgi:hypothetical protein